MEDLPRGSASLLSQTDAFFPSADCCSSNSRRCDSESREVAFVEITISGEKERERERERERRAFASHLQESNVVLASSTISMLQAQTKNIYIENSRNVNCMLLRLHEIKRSALRIIFVILF